MFKRLFHKINRFLNAVRTLEISYYIEDEAEENRIMNELDVPSEEATEDVKYRVDFNNAVCKLREQNKQKSIEQLKWYLFKKMIKDGLLPTNKDTKRIEKEAIVRFEIYKNSELVDELYNFKPGVQEVLTTI